MQVPTARHSCDPFPIGRRQLMMTEFNERIVANWLQFAHIADSALSAIGIDVFRTACIMPSSLSWASFPGVASASSWTQLADCVAI
jgi:hypothetical protein